MSFCLSFLDSVINYRVVNGDLNGLMHLGARVRIDAR